MATVIAPLRSSVVATALGARLGEAFWSDRPEASGYKLLVT
jgi:hypothetical protein